MPFPLISRAAKACATRRYHQAQARSPLLAHAGLIPPPDPQAEQIRLDQAHQVAAEQIGRMEESLQADLADVPTLQAQVAASCSPERLALIERHIGGLPPSYHLGAWGKALHYESGHYGPPGMCATCYPQYADRWDNFARALEVRELIEWRSGPYYRPGLWQERLWPEWRELLRLLEPVQMEMFR